MSPHALAVNITVEGEGSSQGGNGSSLLRGYAHCGLYPNDVTLALINLSPNESISIDISGLSEKKYHLRQINIEIVFAEILKRLGFTIRF